MARGITLAPGTARAGGRLAAPRIRFPAGTRSAGHRLAVARIRLRASGGRAGGQLPAPGERRCPAPDSAGLLFASPSWLLGGAPSRPSKPPPNVWLKLTWPVTHQWVTPAAIFARSKLVPSRRRSATQLNLGVSPQHR